MDGGDQPPQLPPGGAASVLSTVSQTLAFHSSPDSFLAARQTRREERPQQQQQQQQQQQEQESGSTLAAAAAVRAKILNRDVAVVTSYRICEDILDAAPERTRRRAVGMSRIRAAREGEEINTSTFGVLPAYRELMADFFPMPNLLLLDEPEHQRRRQSWDNHIRQVSEASAALIRRIAWEELSVWAVGSTVDLYEQMKGLTWRILLAVFLGLNRPDRQYQTVISLQEKLLRGQFSLFPVSINTPFWRSSRSRGLSARAKLQQILRENVDTNAAASVGGNSRACPFAHHESHHHHNSQHESGGGISREELASNALLFTSSIAVKAISSLLTASLLNLFLCPGQPSLATLLREQQDAATRDAMLQSILLETERLSPPVVGVMRRVQQDIVIASPVPAQTPPTLVPAGWDAWLYFVGTGRDADVYDRANRFVPERYMSEPPPQPGFAFGLGDKECLGKDIARNIVRTVATVMLDLGLNLEGTVEERGVRGWLGWDENVPAEVMAKDLKQLPCQRPRKPIKLRVVCND